MKTTVPVRKKRLGSKKYRLHWLIFLTGISGIKHVMWL